MSNTSQWQDQLFLAIVTMDLNRLNEGANGIACSSRGEAGLGSLGSSALRGIHGGTRTPRLRGGPLKSFLSRLLGVDVNRITIFSISALRRLSAALRTADRRARRLLANLEVDYTVQVEETEVEEVVTQMNEVVTEMTSGNSSRRSKLQESLQEDLAEMNLTVEVLGVQVIGTSLDTKADQPGEDGIPTWLVVLLVIVALLGACGLCAIVVLACRKKKKPQNLPTDLPTIHRNTPNVSKAKSNATMASTESGPYVVSSL
eukprot:Skav221525  [mRNA]  locus=scaffold1248:225703:227797:- [translate_table: standard]